MGVKKFFIFYIMGEGRGEEVNVLFLFSAMTPHHTRHCGDLREIENEKLKIDISLKINSLT